MPALKPDLSGSNFSDEDLRGADLRNLDWRFADLRRVDLRAAHLEGTRLDFAFLQGARLTEASMVAASMVQVFLTNAELNGADLRNASLRGTDLTSASLQGANLEKADLERAFLRAADLTGAQLRTTSLIDANLRDANLTRADLSAAKIVGTQFDGTILHDSNMAESRIQWAVFANNDMRSVRGLEKVIQNGPSTIGIDTMYQSKGQIPVLFLRKAGVPESLITNMSALVAATDPIQFYSCFISYASEDQTFADRLDSNLRSKGVRCWLSTRDLRIGDKFRSSIEQAIRVYDKLLLVLSESSITSPWVEDEVESALERERRENRLVIFPVRIDDAIEKTKVAWAAHLRQKRNLGDFRRWREDDAYRRGFDGLLKDLVSEASGDKKNL